MKQTNIKTPLRFDHSLEGLTELKKAVILAVMVYDSKRIEIKISRVKRSMEPNLGGTRNKASGCPLSVTRTALNSLSNHV